MSVDAVGGVWRYAMDLAAGLAESGVSVLFAGLGPKPSPEQRAEAERIGRLAWLDQPLDWTVESEAALDGVAPALARLARAEGADLVHLNAPSQAVGLDLSCPVVVVSHSCVVSWFRAVRGSDCPPGWEWHLGANRTGFDRADAAVAPSRSHADLLERCYGPIRDLHVAWNASARSGHAVTREKSVFAAARWWDEGKNGRVLDEAAGLARWPVRMAGSLAGPNGQSFHANHAEAPGPLSPEATRTAMARAGIFCSPSLYEPFGLAALEAALSGTPLVLADIPTYRELWDGAALFAPAGDARAFAAAFDRLAEDPALRAALGARARVRAERYNTDIQREAMLSIYASVLSRRAAPPALAS